MGIPWCAKLPLVTVPRCDTPKALTFVYPYYENHAFLMTQLFGWLQYPEDLRRNLSLIVVDDGSPTAPAVDVFNHEAAPCPTRVFRIQRDVRWNWLAARNIGFHHAPEGWVLVTDMDHVVTADTLRSVMYGDHDPSVIYGFSRSEHTGESLIPHPNSWLMTRAMFWTVGGYDETLSGHYGTDGDWRRRCAKVAPIHILTDALVRHEYEQDSSTTRYLRKQPEDAGVKRLVAKRKPGWHPKTLSFPYNEVSVGEARCQ